MSIVSNKPTITRKEMEGVLDCLINGELISGYSVKNFENAISALLKTRFSLSTNSSTSAYHLVFKALEIGNSDEVIVPSFFDIAPLSAITLAGASAILTDIEENSFAPSPDQIKAKITDRTKAIVIGHNFGFPVDITGLAEINIPIIEDLSHIIGGEIREESLSNVINVVSFAPGSLITTGNGGVISTGNSRLYSTMKDYRDNRSNNLNIGYDYCLTDFQAAMGIHQLNRLQAFIKRRKDIAKLYYDSMKFSNHKLFYHFSEEFLYQSFPVIFDSPLDKVESYWKKAKIEISRPVSIPLHKYLNLKPMDYPNSERLSNKLFSLPIYPGLTKKEIEKISKAVAKFL
ncbi:MAG: DegT/DnrJ/EryC1/StrS aminotransferase family protein [Spirochaetes bacterium]|nr:DegT/DnrJ/EryC1/StrS aminotransferase family protein [Spirochaetota bacterium]